MSKAVNPEVSALVGTLIVEESSGERWFDFGRNPAAAERVGTLIADRARSYGPDTVVSWFNPDETVLAHIVARELGVVRTSIELDLGLLSLESELPERSRIILVSTFWNRQRPLASLRTLLEGRGHAVIAAFSLIPSEAGAGDIDDLPLIRLVD